MSAVLEILQVMRLTADPAASRGSCRDFRDSGDNTRHCEC